MFERFTERGRQVVVLAQEEARGMRHAFIGAEHLLLGVFREEEGLGARVLEQLGFTIDGARERILAVSPSGEEVTVGQIPFTPRARKALDTALREALSIGHNYIGTEHLLLGLSRESEGPIGKVLGDRGEEIRAEVIRMLSSNTARGDDELSPEARARAEAIYVAAHSVLIDEVDVLAGLQMELAKRGFCSSVTTFRVNREDARRAPTGNALRTLTGWHARLTVLYEQFDRQAMDVLAGLAADHGCELEWSQRDGATFRRAASR